MIVQTEAERTSTAKTKPLIGLVAGEGKLPGILARSAREKGYRVISAALSELAKANVVEHCDKVLMVAPGQLGRNLKLLRQEGIEQIVFIGKVPKLNILRDITKLDWTAIRELSKLSDFNDDTVQRAVGNFMETNGIKVLTQREFLQHLFPNVGAMTQRALTAAEYADIQMGFKVAKEISRLDIGQTVIVRDQMIMAIEAIEGTDRAIRRAVELARGPVVVVKVSKPGQDDRFDIPTVGMSTLESMIGNQPGGVLAIEAGQTLVVDRDEMLSFAEQNGIAIVAV
jgi:DUF1009 family protein